MAAGAFFKGTAYYWTPSSNISYIHVWCAYWHMKYERPRLIWPHRETSQDKFLVLTSIWNMQNVVFYRKENEVCPYLRNNWSKKHRSATSDVIFNQDGFLDFASKSHSLPKLMSLLKAEWMDRVCDTLTKCYLLSVSKCLHLDKIVTRPEKIQIRFSTIDQSWHM